MNFKKVILTKNITIKEKQIFRNMEQKKYALTKQKKGKKY